MISDLRKTAYRFKRQASKLLHGTQGLTTIYVYKHDLIAVPTITPLIDCQLVEITEANLTDICQIWPTQIERLRLRLERGNRCFAVYSDERIVHYSWVQVGGHHFLQPAGRELNLSPAEAVFFHVRVAAWAQGKGIASFGYTEGLRLLRQNGINTAWVYTTSGNIASQKSIEKSGWRRILGYRALHVADGVFLPLPGRIVYQ